MSTIAISGEYERTLRSRSSAVPHWPTILKPLPVSRLAIPSRSRTASSARTTRMGASASCGSGGSVSTRGIVADRRTIAAQDRSGPRDERLDRLRRKPRLRDEAERRAGVEERPEVGRVEARGEDHGRRGRERPELLGDREPVEVRELDVDDREVGRMRLCGPDALGAGCSLGHDDEAAALQQLPYGGAEVVVVVDHEHAEPH